MNKSMKSSMSSIVMGLLSLNVGLQSAYAIEGGTAEAVAENRKTLEAVVKMNFLSTSVSKTKAGLQVKSDGLVTCSSTLIAKNILLTAWHCAEDMEDGDGIILNGDQHYSIEKVLKPRRMYLGGPLNKELTDVAVILFKAESCEKSALKNAAPIAIAKAKDEHTYSSKILMSGYGLTQMDRKDSGVLRAGYNEVVSRDELTGFDQKRLKTLIEGRPVIAIADREDTKLMNGKVGETADLIKLLTQNKAVVKTDGRAMVYPGDSGGSAISTDENGNPVVIGVTSQIAASAKVEGYEFTVSTATDAMTFPLTFEEAKKLKSGLVEALAIVLDVSNRKLAIFDEQLKVLKDYQVTMKTKRTSVSEYASVQAKRNSRFIEKALNELSAIRDQAGKSFCQ